MRLALALALLPLAATAQEWDGFCGNYVQTTSNAGACANCRLGIADNPKIQYYGIFSDTGWEAEAYWVEGDEGVAQGDGEWGPVGGAYDRARFDIELVKLGEVLEMTMIHHDPALGGPIVATFVCLD